MCAFTTDFERGRTGYSPDRVDALIELSGRNIGRVLPDDVAPVLENDRRGLGAVSSGRRFVLGTGVDEKAGRRIPRQNCSLGRCFDTGCSRLAYAKFCIWRAAVSNRQTTPKKAIQIAGILSPPYQALPAIPLSRMPARSGSQNTANSTLL